jgi:hypothetical protein
MKQVNAEREAAARGEPSPPRAAHDPAAKSQPVQIPTHAPAPSAPPSEPSPLLDIGLESVAMDVEVGRRTLCVMYSTLPTYS